MRTPLSLWLILISPMPPCWWAVVYSGYGIDDRAFFWVGIGAALPLTLYVVNRLLILSALAAQRRWLLPGREDVSAPRPDPHPAKVASGSRARTNDTTRGDA